MSTCFVAGIIKGVLEHGDPYRHFGSLMGYREHLKHAVVAGLVVEVGNKVQVTTAGRNYYAKHGLERLPQGRSYFWSNNDWNV